jgi:valyl-tRNA synthetase
VRSGLLFSAPAGNDLLFDEKLCEQGRNFSNKVWNAFRLLKGLEVVDGKSLPEHLLATEWLTSKISSTIIEVQDHFSKFRISDALLSIYNLVWDDFCGKYLEIIKPAYQTPIHADTLQDAFQIFDQLMRLLHPYMPFITEEIWQAIDVREAKSSICKASFPTSQKINNELIQQFDTLFEVLTKIREIRNSKQLSPKLALTLEIKTKEIASYEHLKAILSKLANLESIVYVDQANPEAQTFVVRSDQFFVPLQKDENQDDLKEESEKELVYLEGFKKSVEAKLANDKFVQNAKPDLVEREKQKLSDTENKIKSLREILARFN